MKTIPIIIISVFTFVSFIKADEAALTPNQIEKAILDEVAKDILKYDTNGNATAEEILEPDEWATYLRDHKKKIQAQVAKKVEDKTIEIAVNNGREPVTREFVGRILGTSDDSDQSYFRRHAIQIRGDYKELTTEELDDDGYKKAVAKASSSDIAYTRSHLGQDKDIWNFKGTIGYLLRPRNTYDRVGMIAAVTFDRVNDDVKPKNDTDSLVFRLGTEWHSNKSSSSPFGLDYTSAWVEYGTSFDFSKDVFGASADFNGYGGLKKYKKIGKISYAPSLHIEGGVVSDHAGDTDLIGFDDYLRIGPTLSIRYEPAGTKRLTFLVDAGYYVDVLAADDRYLVTAGLEYQLDEEGHLILSVKYRKGQLPLTHEQVNETTFGIGIKW